MNDYRNSRPVSKPGRLFLRVLYKATPEDARRLSGGGTIPLLQMWLSDGMSLGSATAFMITGPATKITSLGALKIAMGWKRFLLYIVFVMLIALVSGMAVNLFLLI